MQYLFSETVGTLRWKIDKDNVQDHTCDDAEGEKQSSQGNGVQRGAQNHNSRIQRWYDSVNNCVTDGFIEKYESHRDGDEQK